MKSNARPEREQRPPRGNPRQAQHAPGAQLPRDGRDHGNAATQNTRAQPPTPAAANQPTTAAAAQQGAAARAGSPAALQVNPTANRQSALPETSRDRARRAMSEKNARDRLLNLQREEQAKARARNAEVKQLIETHRLPRTDGDIAHNFILGKKIKRMYVTREQQAQLIVGTIVIATQKDRHDLVPAAVGEKILQRDPRCVVLPRQLTAGEPDAAYAAFQVPDDLDW